MENFITKIKETISNTDLQISVKKSIIEDTLSKLKVVQTKDEIPLDDKFIEVVITFNSLPVEKIGLCAKDIDGWSFKPGKSDVNGTAKISVTNRGDSSTKETFFIITHFWKNQFFHDQNIEMPYFKVNL